MKLYRLPVSRNLALAIANVMGGMLYLVLMMLAVAPRPATARKYPSLLIPALVVLGLFFLINLAWGAAMLTSPRWRRRDYYGFVWLYWIVVAILGSPIVFI